MGKKSQKTTTNTQPPPYVQSALKSFLPDIAQTADKPLQFYQGQIVAPFSDLQNTAFGQIPGAATAAQPYIQSAANLTNQGTAPVTPMQWSPEAIAQFQNPYTQQVVNATQQAFNLQNQEQQANLTGNAASQHALGGDRVGVAQAELAKQQAAVENPQLAQLYSQGFQQATGEFNTQQQTALAAQQANAYRALYGAGEMGNLGELAQGTALTGAGAELNAGSLQQQQAQANLNVPYEQFLQAQQYPFYTTQFEGNLLSQLAGGAGGVSTQQTPGPNLFSQLAGLGLAGASLFGKRGGRFAAGGGLEDAPPNDAVTVPELRPMSPYNADPRVFSPNDPHLKALEGAADPSDILRMLNMREHLAPLQYMKKKADGGMIDPDLRLNIIHDDFGMAPQPSGGNAGPNLSLPKPPEVKPDQSQQGINPITSAINNMSPQQSANLGTGLQNAIGHFSSSGPDLTSRAGSGLLGGIQNAVGLGGNAAEQAFGPAATSITPTAAAAQPLAAFAPSLPASAAASGAAGLGAAGAGAGLGAAASALPAAGAAAGLGAAGAGAAGAAGAGGMLAELAPLLLLAKRGGRMEHYDQGGEFMDPPVGAFGPQPTLASEIGDVGNWFGSRLNALGSKSINREAPTPHGTPGDMPGFLHPSVGPIHPPKFNIANDTPIIHKTLDPRDLVANDGAAKANVSNLGEGPPDTIEPSDADEALMDQMYASGQPNGTPEQSAPGKDEGTNPFGMSDKQTALLTAGLGMMASPSHYFLQGVGQGGLEGLQMYQKQKLAENEMKYRQAMEKKAEAMSDWYMKRTDTAGQNWVRGPTTYDKDGNPLTTFYNKYDASQTMQMPGAFSAGSGKGASVFDEKMKVGMDIFGGDKMKAAEFASGRRQLDAGTAMKAAEQYALQEMRSDPTNPPDFGDPGVQAALEKRKMQLYGEFMAPPGYGGSPAAVPAGPKGGGQLMYPKSREDFKNYAPGTRYVNPKDGKVYTYNGGG